MKKYLKQFAINLIAIAAMVYVVVSISISVNDKIEVENAYYAEANKLLTTDAYIFRDEEPLLTDSNGIPCRFFNEGEKVSRGSEVVRIYVDEHDADIQDRINLLNRKISVLERSSVSKTYSTTDLTALDKSIASRVYDMILSVENDNLTMASVNKDELLILMNRHFSLTHTLGGYEMFIDKYKAEVAELKGRLKGTSDSIKAERSGYYYSSVDGYEGIFTLDALDELTAERFDELKNIMPDEKLVSSSAGKIIKSSRWYIAVKTYKTTAVKLTSSHKSDEKFEVIFPYSDGRKIKMRLDKTFNQANSDYSVMVFSTDTVPDNFNYTRSQPVSIVLADYSGLKVPSSAIRVVDGKIGVYMLDGNIVVFKTTTVLYTENGYCICKLPFNDINQLSKKELSLYDPVISSGKDLYEGKIIN